MSDNPTRRRFIAGLTAGTLAVGLAGCTSLGQSTDGNEDGSEDEHDDGDHEGDDHENGTDDHNEEDGHDEEGDHGGDDHGHDTVGEMTPTAEVAVNTSNGETHFNPHVSRVETGGSVTWILESGAHTATAYHPDNGEPQLVPDGSEAWDSGVLSDVGEEFEHTFETEGVYHYFCDPHESSGMIGSVIVGEPDPHDQPALEDPPADKPATVRHKIEDLNTLCNGALGHQH